MIARIFSATLLGLQPRKIEIEVEARRGVPGLIIIGLPNKVVNEAKERIISAFGHCGIKMKSRRTVINLAPADIPKTNSIIELAMAVGLLRQYELIKQPPEDTLFLGELSLDGKIKAVKGILPIALSAQKMGFQQIVFPRSNLKEVRTISNLRLFPIDSLQEYLAFGKGENDLQNVTPEKFSSPKVSLKNHNSSTRIRLNEIIGQDFAKRALEIAAAGRHNLMLFGPPGMGKSLLAQALPSLLPLLSEEESLEVSTIYSVSRHGTGRLLRMQPFRAPHHTISRIALIGGGRDAAPGEISLAHNGVLFLDEMTEFDKRTLESLRQPLEDKKITITRSLGSVMYPANFLLVGAANPCACGYYQSTQQSCRCSPAEIRHFQKKLSGAILDRIDLFVRVGEIKIQQMADDENKNYHESHKIRDKISQVRQVQRTRYGNNICNADLTVRQIKKFCLVDKLAKNTLSQAGEKGMISVRGYFKILKVARTIADLEGEEQILQKHILEAFSYRDMTNFSN